MARLIAILLVSAVLVGSVAPAASAGGRTATNVALGLASFAVFNQLFGPVLFPRPVFATPVYPAPVYVAAPPQVIYAPPPQLTFVPPPTPAPPTVIQYPHGRYELRGDGVTMAYQWVWIPSPPPAPPARYEQPATPPSPPAAAPSAAEPCKATGRYVKTPQGVLPECE